MDINSLTIGIIAGLITTLLIVILKSMFDKILIPWYEQRVYKDIKISGKWDAKYEANYGREIITINQTAHYISGTIITTTGEDKGNIYSFEGIFKNLILTASYSSNNRTSIDRGTITLRIEDNGNKLVGYCALYDDDSQKIKSIKYNLKRKDKA